MRRLSLRLLFNLFSTDRAYEPKGSRGMRPKGATRISTWPLTSSLDQSKPCLAQQRLDRPVMGFDGHGKVHLGFEAHAHGEDLIR